MNQFKTYAIDFTPFIEERTRDFTGREWVLEAITQWLADPDAPRFFLVSGEPGSGKTALAGQLVRLSSGKVAAPPDIKALDVGFLDAVHFCAAAESRWISPIEFTGSIAEQLAKRHPIYRRALVESGLHSQIAINIEQQVAVAAPGAEVTAFAVENLHLQIGAMPTEEAFLRLLRGPLEQLCADEQHKGSQVVILVDSLDEARSYSGEKDIVWLLGQTAALPHEVRFIVTSRDDAMVRDILGKLRECSLTSTAEADKERYQADIKRYVETTVAARGNLTGRLAVDLSPEVFVAELVSRSQGNFLYVYHLLKMLTSQEGSIDCASLDRLPAGLNGIYHSMLDRLVGKQRDRWDKQYGPLLGTLAVVREGLTEAQWEAFSGVKPGPALRALAEFLDKQLAGSERASFAIYHRSFADFLLDQTQAKDYWCQPVAQDARIVEYYRRGARAWTEVAWATIDDYGLLHLAEHLARLSNRQELFALLCPPFMAEKSRRFGSHELFAQDVALAMAEALGQQPPNLAQAARAALLFASLGSLANAAPPAAVGVLARLGHEDRARGFAAMMPDPARRGEAYRLIGEALLAQGRPAANVLTQALAAVEAVPQQADRGRALAALANPMAQVGMLNRFRMAAVNLQSEGARATALSALARELVKRDYSAEETLALVQKVKSAPAQAAILSAIIEEVDLTNRAVLGQVLAAAEELKDGALVATVFVVAARALAKKGYPAKAIEVAARVESMTWATVIADKPTATGDTSTEPGLKSDANQPDPVQASASDHSIQSNQESIMVLLVPALGMAHAWDRAGAVIDGIKDPYYNGLARKACAPLLAGAGLVDDARKVVDGITVQVVKSAAISDVACVLAASDQVNTALDLIATIEEEAEQLAARARLALALARLDQAEMAVAVSLDVLADLQKFDANRSQTSLWHAVQNSMSETIKSGDERLYLLALSQSAQALAFSGRFAEARTAADAITKGPSMDTGTRFRRALETKFNYGRGAWMIRMEELYRSIYQSYLFAAALRALATAQACAGRTADTAETVAAIKKARWRAEALTEVAAALAAAGENTAALEAIDQALGQGEIPTNDYLRMSALFALDGLLDDLEQKKAGMPAKVRDALVRIRQPVTQSRALQESLREAAELTEAGQLVRATRDSAVRGDNMTAVMTVSIAVAASISVLLTRGETLNAAIRSVANVPQALNVVAKTWRSDTFCELAGRLSNAVSLQDAQVKAGLLMDVALALAGESTDPEQAARVAAGAQALADPQQRVAVLALTGLFDQAVMETMRIEDPAARAAALADVAQAMALGKHKDQAGRMAITALVTISPVDDAENKEKVMREIGRALALVSKRGRASQTLWQARSVVEATGERLAAAANNDGVAGTLARRTGLGRLLGRAAPARAEPVVSKSTLPAPPELTAGADDDAGSDEESLPDEARAVLSQQLQEDTMVGLVWMAESLLQQGDRQSALENARELLNQVETLPKPGQQAIFLTTIARVLAHTGDRDAALRAASQAVAQVEFVPDPDTRVTLLIDLALLLVGAGESGRAAELARKAHGEVWAVQDKGAQAAMLVTLAHYYSEQAQQDRMTDLFGRALNSARLAGRPAVFSVLQRAARDLARLDDGNTLREIRATVSEVESWWVAPATTGTNQTSLP